MVCALLKNVANFVSCVIDQFLGGLLNGIIDLIIAGMSTALGVLSLLLSFSNFNLEDTIRNLVGSLLGIPLSLNCGEEETDPGVEKWTIGTILGSYTSITTAWNVFCGNVVCRAYQNCGNQSLTPISHSFARH